VCRVVGDVGRERVAVVASSLVTWHERGAGGGADVGGMAVERAAAVLTWHTKRWRRLAPTVTWHVVGLWMRDEVGGGGQRGVQLTCGPRFLVCSRSLRRRALRIRHRRRGLRIQRCHCLRIGCRRRALEVAASLGLRWWRRCGRRRGGGGGDGDEGTGMVMVVVRRKGTTWQRLNPRYSIWEVAGRGAGIGNMLTLFPVPENAVVVQYARALLIYMTSGSIPQHCTFFCLLLLILNIIQYN
jgi:hypothetical protein